MWGEERERCRAGSLPRRAMRAATGRAADAARSRTRHASSWPERGPYARVSDADLKAFDEICGEGGVVTDPVALETFNR